MRRLRGYVENAPAHSEHGVPAHSGQHVQEQSGQHVRAHSEQGTGQRVQAHSGQSFPARSQSRPDKQIRLPSQSRLHSPTQSGENTCNEPLQLSAQSRQHTPEAQSHPSTLNVSSTDANDDRGNRRSGVDGPSRHTSGSASHRLVAARLKLQYKRDPTADEIFFVAHTRHLKKKKYPIGEDGEDGMDDEDDDGGEVVWIDKKSERIYEIYINELMYVMDVLCW
ncbi:hypothetical protein POM88_011201 [Heracleum sosnowskyi]|uniref:Uncharacterized protein n=1 Tax=Heracleum sosnowskyi TaxID=360622 RepID=A0AAD8MWB1_9APIA|nr:hypothetical protein POM88_011201 [Heracleum sosnowskyi]